MKSTLLWCLVAGAVSLGCGVAVEPEASTPAELMRIHHPALSPASTSALVGGDVALMGDPAGCNLSACHGSTHGSGGAFARAREQLRTAARPVAGDRSTNCNGGQCESCHTTSGGGGAL